MSIILPSHVAARIQNEELEKQKLAAKEARRARIAQVAESLRNNYTRNVLLDRNPYSGISSGFYQLDGNLGILNPETMFTGKEIAGILESISLEFGFERKN